MRANGNRLIVIPTRIYCATGPQLLLTIIRNLLDNANKYTSNGEVTLTAAWSGKTVVITVTDTGRGLSA